MRQLAVNRGALAGFVALAAIALLIGGAFASLLLAAADLDAGAILRDAYIRHVLGFALWQAALSTLLSCGLALPVARAFARRAAFPGRTLLLRLFVLPLVMPVIVAVFGVVAVFGQSGWINAALSALGLPRGQYLYGLAGILIAHVFFNLPLAVRLLLPAWQSVPGDSWRLAAQLGMGSGAIFRVIELPLLRQTLPGVAVLVFMLCFTSFAVVLTLGGGPAATTLEVAIYQSLRFDFDLGRAVALALLQLALCTALVGFGYRLMKPMETAPLLRAQALRPDLASRVGRAGDAVAILSATLFVALPVLAVLADGLAGPIGAVAADPVIWMGALRSLGVGIAAGLLCLGLSAALAGLQRRWRLRKPSPAAGLVEFAGMAGLMVSPLALGTGLFLLFRPVVDRPATALGLVVIMNALMALPYALKVLASAALDAARQYDRLCAGLGIAGWNRLRLVEWPILRRPVALSLALAASLAVGDLGAIALFGRSDTATLPLLLYQQIAAYRLQAAGVTALLLLAVSLGLFAAFERGMGGRASR